MSICSGAATTAQVVLWAPTPLIVLATSMMVLTICSSKLLLEEALELAVKGKTNLDFFVEFREHYLNLSVTFGKNSIEN